MEANMPRPSPSLLASKQPTLRPLRQKRLKLDFLKCRYCRSAKQKCFPSERQWPGQRCQRCGQLNLPCSEPQRASSSIRRTSQASLQTPEVECGPFQPASGSITQYGQSNLSGKSSPPIRDDATHSQPTSPHSLINNGQHGGIFNLLGSIRHDVETVMYQLHTLVYDDSQSSKPAPNMFHFPEGFPEALQGFDITNPLFQGHTRDGELRSPGDLTVNADLHQEDRTSKTADKTSYHDSSDCSFEYHGTSTEAHPPSFDAASCMTWPQPVPEPGNPGFMDMYLACRIGDDMQVDRLLNLGTYDWRRELITGQSPLHVAASMGHTAVCRLLLEKYPHQDAHTNYGSKEDFRNQKDCTQSTPLLCAASGGHLETVEFFCNHDPKPLDDQHRDRNGNCAVGLAVRGGHLKVANSLIQHGFAPDLVDHLGRSPLWHATHGSHHDIMELLVTQTELDRKDNDGRTPLAEAARIGDCKAATILLSQNNIDRPISKWSLLGLKMVWKVYPNSKDQHGSSPLLLAVEGGHVEIAKLLLNYRPSAFRREDAFPAFKLARHYQNLRMVQTLQQAFLVWSY